VCIWASLFIAVKTRRENLKEERQTREQTEMRFQVLTATRDFCEATGIELDPNNTNREDGLCLICSWKPLIHSLKIRRNPLPRSELPLLSSGQLALPVRSVAPRPHLLASFRFPPRPCKGPIYILSHSHTIPLSLFCRVLSPPPTTTTYPPYRLPSPIPHRSA
jgi:hypothetical protein